MDAGEAAHPLALAQANTSCNVVPVKHGHGLLTKVPAAISQRPAPIRHHSSLETSEDAATAMIMVELEVVTMSVTHLFVELIWVTMANIPVGASK
jgi:hypothetical protein